VTDDVLARLFATAQSRCASTQQPHRCRREPSSRNFIRDASSVGFESFLSICGIPCFPVRHRTSSRTYEYQVEASLLGTGCGLGIRHLLAVVPAAYPGHRAGILVQGQSRAFCSVLGTWDAGGMGAAAWTQLFIGYNSMAHYRDLLCVRGY